MNLDSLSIALSQISYLVTNLTKKNFKCSTQEILNLVSHQGSEAERYLLCSLFSQVDFTGDGKSGGKDSLQVQYLAQECDLLFRKPNLVSTLSYAFSNTSPHQSLTPSNQLLTQISATLKLNPLQDTVLGISLLVCLPKQYQNLADTFVLDKLLDIVTFTSELDCNSGDIQILFSKISIEACQFLIQFILSNQDITKVTLNQLRKLFGLIGKEFRDHSFVIKPLSGPQDLKVKVGETNQICSDMAKSLQESVSDAVLDIGYSFCKSIEECRSHLKSFGLSEITPSVVAQILGVMVRTHSNLVVSANLQSMGNSGASIWNESKDKSELLSTSSWNIAIFVSTLEELVPSLNWKDVVLELDHPKFVVKDRLGFKLLFHALGLGLKNDEFPVQHLYRRWRNVEGQLSVYQQSLKNSDIFCFADYTTNTVALEMLKAPPDDDNQDIATWKSLDFVESLLDLSDAGPYVPVRDLFTYPIQHCPDVLIINMLQINAQINRLRQELLTSLVPIFLVNHPNSAIILQYAWHTQNNSSSVRAIVMRAMPEWYMRGDNDQTRLSRILDVAQDLKALSLLLNGSPLPFVIDLACLASRREYLKLDKWLTDKIREHGEQFIQACVQFLKRRCPQIIGGLVKEENLPKSAHLPPETLNTMLACLQTKAGNVSQELSEAILTMVGNCNILLNKPRQPPPGVVKTPRGLEPAFSSSSLPSVSLSNSTTLDPLVAGIGSGMAGLTLGSGAGTRIGPNTNSVTSASSASIGGVFPLSGSLNSFANAPSSPAKMMFAGLNNSNSNSGSQSAFSSLLPPSMPIPTSQVPNQSSASNLGDMSAIFSNSSPSVSKEVEEEANRYFACIYNIPQPTMTVDELLEMLKRFKDSPVQLEREIFSCMLRYLFEEYRFFPKYPDKDLQINAQLFGGIIEHGLVNFIDLGLALRYVLEALRKPHGSNMYYFGITALDRCKNRLKEYPQYCQYLALIPHFNEFPAHLNEFIEFGSRSQEPPNRTIGIGAAVTSDSVSISPVAKSVVTSVSSTSTKTMTTLTSTTTAATTKPTAAIGTKPSIANATNIDTLLVATEKDDKIEDPPEAIQDKIAFIVNNLSLANLSQKCEEIKEVLKDVHWPWLSQYIVMKRASIEPNFHNLYSNFLDTLKLQKLSDMVVKETYRNIKVLLRSDKGIANFSDRSLLKNLGHWLGILTLTKNKPILQLDLDIKSLLIEAYHNGQQELLYVVPFIAKVLDSCGKSRVFKAPNPWTIGIMNVLAELHTEPDLKLNLKFEIEVLCKTLNLDLSDLRPGNTLKDPDKLAQIEPQLSQLSKHKELALIQRIAVSGTPNVISSVGQLEDVQSHHLVSGTPFGISAPNNTGFSTPTSMFFSSNPPNSSNTPSNLESEALTPTITPQPQFNYADLNVSAIGGITNHVQISNQITLFQQHPQLKQFVSPSIERAVQDWILQVVERSIKIALTTCEQIVRKDFALDPEESRMRAAAHHMICSLTAGMAMITCKDHLSVGISNNLKTNFNNALKGAGLQNKELVEQAITTITQDNLELACCFIQKTAVEKAIPEIDKRLATEFELRKHARNEGRRYCDPAVLTYQAERMPEQIRLKVGGVMAQQMAVYEEFAKNIPGFLPTSEPLPLVPMSSTAASTVLPASTHTTPASTEFLAKPIPVIPTPVSLPCTVDEISQIYDKVVVELENYIRGIIAPLSNPQVAALHSLHEAVLVAKTSRELVAAMVLLQKAVEGLLEGMTPQLSTDPDLAMRFRDSHLLVLKALQNPRSYGPQWTNKHVTRVVLECREELHYNLDAIDCLIRNHLLNLPQYDLHLAQSMENGMHYVAVQFAMQLCKLYLIDDRHAGTITDSDFFNTVETLYKIASHSRQPPEGLNHLIELIRSNNDPGFLDRAPGGPTSLMHSGISQAREYDDPPGLHDKTEYLLREWVTMYHSPTAGRDSTKAFSIFVHQMNIQGILKTDDLITRFFRLSTEMCVDLCYRALAEPNSSQTLIRVKCFHTLDAFVRLIALLVKHSGDTSNTNTKINLLNKVLGIVTGVLIQDHEVRNNEFQQLPYHRIFIMLFLELNSPEPILETINFQVLTAFCNTLHILRPTRAPGFAYAWLELVSHRVLIGRMLHLTPQQKAWGMFAQLMMDLFKFMAPFLRNAELPKPMGLLYKGTLRVLLVLLHDFPEFLCDYHYGFCDVIPPNCIQMRNLILSAFPRNMRLPDPFTPNLKVDMLSEIAHAPRVLTNFSSMIQPPTFKKDLDSYIKTRGPVTFLSELRSKLQVSSEAGQRYNIPLMNALVLYVGTQAISYIHSKGLTPSMSTITHSSHMDIFQNLAVDLDTEGRYLFLNAISNQLRYPNSHTHYFSCTLLYLFAEANTEAIQEQITRVLLERLIVNRPHPWGLLITFIELIKNPSFHFWNHDFVHCAPEIEKLFESVARSCMQQKQAQVAREQQEPYNFSGSV